jgi:hypothetical protein
MRLNLTLGFTTFLAFSTTFANDSVVVLTADNAAAIPTLFTAQEIVKVKPKEETVVNTDQLLSKLAKAVQTNDLRKVCLIKTGDSIRLTEALRKLLQATEASHYIHDGR